MLCLYFQYWFATLPQTRGMYRSLFSFLDNLINYSYIRWQVTLDSYTPTLELRYLIFETGATFRDFNVVYIRLDPKYEHETI